MGPARIQQGKMHTGKKGQGRKCTVKGVNELDSGRVKGEEKETEVLDN